MSEQTLSERVDALEAELRKVRQIADSESVRVKWRTEDLDVMTRQRDEWKARALAAESRLAQARVEGAREALLRYADHVERMKKKLDSTAHVTADSVRCYARDHYPATGEEPTGGNRCECSLNIHGPFCDPRHPAPQEEPMPAAPSTVGSGLVGRGVVAETACAVAGVCLKPTACRAGDPVVCDLPTPQAAPEPLATDKALTLLLDLLLEIMESPTYAARLRAIRVALAQTTEG